MEPLSLLCLEDNPNDLELYRALLSQAGLQSELTWVKSRDEFLDALEQGGFDIVLLDYKIPSYDGLSALRAVKKRYPEVPVLIVSGTISEQLALDLVKEGATDYVLKDTLDRLIFSIPRALREVKNLASMKEALEALKISEEKFRGVVEHIGIGVALISPDMEILFMNKQMRAWFPDVDDSSKPVCYKAFNMPPREALCTYCPTRITLKDGKVHEAVTETPSGGRTINFRIIASPVTDKEGKITAAIEMVEDITERKHREKQLIQSKDAFLNMLKETDFAYKELKELHEGLVESFANAIDAKSPWTKGHSSRVAQYAVEIAKAMEMKVNDIESLKMAGLLHDIGKIGTYDVILDKPDRLTPEEFEIVKKHPAHGETILRPIRQLHHILPLVRHHHERIDGRGYPDRLKGEEIPVGARILHVADSFDSMTADRPYRAAPGKEYAISELKRCSGTQFDPHVVEVFMGILSDLYPSL